MEAPSPQKRAAALTEENLRFLESRTKKLRKDVLELVFQRKEGHIGGAFSIAELMVAIYDLFLKKEDKFILSKGHAYAIQYLLLKEKGLNPQISGHPEIDIKNGVECTTGSLGHGLPIAVGMAFAKKIKKEPGMVYVILGDGECHEGTTWESLLLAAHYRLDNLKVIVDHNNLMTLGKVSDILSLDNFAEKFRAFNCAVAEIDGHSFPQIISSLGEKVQGKPYVILANTTKGKGVSFMENQSGWHTMVPNQEELKKAIEELG